MPNWCGNTLTLEHEDPEMIKRAETAFADGKFLNEFDRRWHEGKIVHFRRMIDKTKDHFGVE